MCTKHGLIRTFNIYLQFACVSTAILYSLVKMPTWIFTIGIFKIAIVTTLVEKENLCKVITAL